MAQQRRRRQVLAEGGRAGRYRSCLGLALKDESLQAERSPVDSATFGVVLDRYLEVADLEVPTRVNHESYIRRIIGPVLGDVRVRKIGPDSLDALYSHLKRCSRLSGRLPKVEHYASEAHECDERCGPLRGFRADGGGGFSDG